MAFKLIVQTGNKNHPIDLRRINTTYLVDEDGIINPTAFYNYLSVWTSNEDLVYTFSQGNLRPTPKRDHFQDDDSNLHVKRSFAIQYASSKYYIYVKNKDLLATIKEIREISAKFGDLDLPNFPSGPLFIYHEEFLSLPFYFLLIGGSTASIVFVVYYLCTFDFPACLFMVAFQLIIPLHLLGLLGLLGIPLSSAPMIVVVISIGVSSTYTLHVCMIFQHSVGCRNTRMRLALVDICTPTINNALGSLLCLSMLAGAEFGFIVRYFFVLMYSLIIFGLIYTLLIIPVCLSLFGPISTIRAKDGSDQIPQPSPDPSPLLPRRHHRRHRTIASATPLSGSAAARDHHHHHQSHAQHHHRRGGRGGHRYPRMSSDLSLTTITEESESSSAGAPPSIVVRPSIVVVESAAKSTGVGGGFAGKTRSYVATVKSTTHVTVKIRTTLPGEVRSMRRDSSDSDSSYTSL